MNNAEAIVKVRESMDCIASSCLNSLRRLAVNKWSSLSRCLSHISLGVLVHQSMCQGFRKTLASNAEIAQLRQFIAQNAEQQAADAAAGIVRDDPNAFHVMKGKRILGSAAFFEQAETPSFLLCLSIASAPVDKLFATFYECEELARTRKHLRPDGRHNVGLFQSMVKSDGVLHKTLSRISSPVFAVDSPLLQLVPVLPHGRNRWTKARGLHVRMSASFVFHFLGTFWEPQFKMVLVLECEGQEALDMISKLLQVDLHGTCPRCEGIFLVRLRERLLEPPLLSLQDQLLVVVEVYTSLACDPLITSMHLVEGLHSHSRVSTARSMDQRKQLPRRIFSGQALSRWQYIHVEAMGPMKREVPSIKQVIQKTKRVQPKTSRVLVGHDMFVKDAIAAWHSICLFSMLSFCVMLCVRHMG